MCPTSRARLFAGSAWGSALSKLGSATPETLGSQLSSTRAVNVWEDRLVLSESGRRWTSLQPHIGAGKRRRRMGFNLVGLTHRPR